MSISSEASNHATPKGGDALLERSLKVIDLSRDIHQGMPLWPGHQLPFMFVNQDHEGCRDSLTTGKG